MTPVAGRLYPRIAHLWAAPLHRLGIVVLLLLSLVAAWPGLVRADAPLAPDFILKSTQGGNLRLAEYRGHVVMLAFFKNRCRTCEQQLQTLDRLYKRYADQGARAFAVSADLGLAAAQATAAGLQLDFPILIDHDKVITPLYQIDLMPTLVLVDKDGKQRYVHKGYRDTDVADYEKELRQLLSEWQ